MNYFYAPPQDWQKDESVEIKGQEAQHISKVLRHKAGDEILIVDGVGNRCKCVITDISKRSISANIIRKTHRKVPSIKKIIALGAIKKRDRLEFAIEKAVELDAWEICVFNADHSERSKLNEGRLHTLIVSAFKQCGRFYLPRLIILNSLDEVFDRYSGHSYFMAYLGEEDAQSPPELSSELNLLLVGPEGGFSEREAQLNKKNNGSFVSLGENRLRAETAVAAFLSRYLV